MEAAITAATVAANKPTEANQVTVAAEATAVTGPRVTKAAVATTEGRVTPMVSEEEADEAADEDKASQTIRMKSIPTILQQM